MTVTRLLRDGGPVIRKLVWRIVPFLGILYFVSYLDRVNVAFAALTMNGDLQISPAQFGWGAGIFFLGYLLFQVPSNLMLERFGARRWIAVIMVAWGIVSMGMGVITDARQFLLARLLLGFAEAGFFPGVVLYLTRWFPPSHRGRIMAGFMLTVPLASVVGAPLSSLILQECHDWAGLEGWRWLFILEGAPALLGALAVVLLLPDRPDKAAWLDTRERRWLASVLAEAQDDMPQPRNAWATMRDLRVLSFALVYFGLTLSLYGVGLWVPLMLKASGTSVAGAALLSAVPYAVAALGMLIWAHFADARKGAPTANVWVPTVASAAALALLPLADDLLWELACLSVAALGTLAALGTFWTIPTRKLPAGEMAVAVASINAVGNLGGFIGPVMVGWTRQLTNSFHTAALLLAVCIALAAPLLAIAGRPSASQTVRP
jgi:ACS family tartrate transporter-like MFS transporter